MEAPPTTPTQTWKTAVHTLDSLLCSRHIATLPDISHALSWSWAPSNLYTYRGRIARIADRASSSNPTSPDRELVETFLLELLATGSSASTIRTTLSALQCLHSLNILALSIPPVWWRLSTSADRLALRAPQARNWFPLAAFSELGLSFTSSSDMAFLAMLLLSIALGLRIGEAAAIRPCDVVLPTGNMPGYIRILPEKCNPHGSGPTTRCPQPSSLYGPPPLLGPSLDTGPICPSSPPLPSGVKSLVPFTTPPQEECRSTPSAVLAHDICGSKDTTFRPSATGADGKRKTWRDTTLATPPLTPSQFSLYRGPIPPWGTQRHLTSHHGPPLESPY